MKLSNIRVADDIASETFGDGYTPVLKSDPVARDLILEVIDREKKDCHTIRQIREAVGLSSKNPNGLSDDAIHFELQVLQGIEIYHRPGPPVITYWKKGQQPPEDCKVYIGTGGKVEIIAPGEKKDFQAEIARKNAEILKNAKENQLKTPVSLPPGTTQKISQILDLPPHLKHEKEIAVIKELKDEKLDLSESDLDSLLQNLDRLEVKLIPISLLRYHPHNPREYVDIYEEDFIDLTNSIREKGVQEPLLIVLNDDRKTYRVVAGHRRWKGAEAAGLTTVPCLVKKYPSLEYEIEVMYIENEQRKGLTYTQQAKTFQKLLKSNDVHALARRTGKKQSFINDLLKLLKLAPEIQMMVDRGELQLGTGKALAALPFETQKKLIPRVARLRVSEAEILVKQTKETLGIKKYKPLAKTRERVTTDEEKFTRSGALKSLENIGGTFFSPYILQKAFDDVCLDSCLEQKDQSICHSCPVPRFIASLVRRVNQRGA